MKKIFKFLWKLRRSLKSIFQDKSDKIPNISVNIERNIIGKSINWSDIMCYKIWEWNIKILYVSWIHWNEVWTIKLAYNLINWLYENIIKLDNYCIYIMPCLNVDWYDLAIKNPDYFNWWKIWRFNSNNVDLNRNFDTKSFKEKSIRSFWKEYSESVEVFCWKSWNSEAETKILTNFIIKNNISVLFMFHNAWNDVMWNNTELSKKLSKTYSDNTWFKLLTEEYWNTLKQTWTAKEWCDENDITYLEIEWSSRYWSDWKVQKNAIEETLFML